MKTITLCPNCLRVKNKRWSKTQIPENYYMRNSDYFRKHGEIKEVWHTCPDCIDRKK